MKKLQDAELLKRIWKKLLENGLFWTIIFLVMVGIALYLPASVTVSSTVGERELPIYCVDTTEKKIAISFDAAWGNEDTQLLLDILARQGVHATFFMTGGWVDSYPEDVKRIAEAGHDLGNHSQSHLEMSKLGKEEILDEISRVHEKVKALTGKEMILFRPPYGDYNNLLVTTAKECGYYTIQWDCDSLDWKDYGTESIVKTVTQHKNLGNGSIILMHNGAKYTKDALEAVIVALKEEGYTFVPISELIYKDHYHMDHTGRQIADQQ